jgi:phi LC3 family holin
MKINWKVRFKNPMFYVQLVMSILTPIMTYMGITSADLTTWAKLADVLLEAVSNPYVVSLVLISVFNALIDPTTTGFGDSKRALTYTEPKR